MEPDKSEVQIKHKMVRGDVSVTLRGYVEVSDLLRMTEKGPALSIARVKRQPSTNGGRPGAASRVSKWEVESRPASCDPRPSNLFRAPATDVRGELAALRNVLDAEFNTSELGLNGVDSGPSRTPQTLKSRLGGSVTPDMFLQVVELYLEDDATPTCQMLNSLSLSLSRARSLAHFLYGQQLMLDGSKNAYQTHPQDPAPLSMQDLLRLVDDTLDEPGPPLR